VHIRPTKLQFGRTPPRASPDPALARVPTQLVPIATVMTIEPPAKAGPRLQPRGGDSFRARGWLNWSARCYKGIATAGRRPAPPRPMPVACQIVRPAARRPAPLAAALLPESAPPRPWPTASGSPNGHARAAEPGRAADAAGASLSWARFTRQNAPACWQSDNAQPPDASEDPRFLAL